MQPHLPCKLFDPARSGPPLACKASALLTELATQNLSLFVGADTGASLFGMASPVRIFPGCTILWRGRDYYTSPYPLERTWWREMDLNHQPLAYEANALPDCAIPLKTIHSTSSALFGDNWSILDRTC